MKKLSEDRFLADLFTKDAVQANFLQRIIDGINNVAKGAGVAVTGDLAPPPPIGAITVKTSGEMIHATLTHNAEVTRAIEYHIEADTSPNFTQPHPISIHSSRTHIFSLPTFNDAGNPQPWYLRAFSQYPGSPPSVPTVLGGVTNPTALQLKGATKLTLLPSTGSGTASSNGQQGGSGRGRQRVSTPKVVRIGKQQSTATAVAAPIIQNSHLGTGSTPQFSTDQSPFNINALASSVSFNWSAFNLYRNDGSITVIPASPAGGVVVTGLSPTTLYRFYPYWDELAQNVFFASGGVGSPSFAFASPSPTAGQQQTLTTHAPLSDGALQVTTGSGSQTGGGRQHQYM